MIRSLSGRWFMIQEVLDKAVGKRVLAYGAGLVGGWVCSELSGHITVVDRDQTVLDGLSEQQLDSTRTLVCADALEHAHTTDLSQFSLILNMLPGRIGGKLREQLISSGTCVVDIAFAEDIPSGWHEVASAAGTTFVHDVGIAPGLSNMLIAAASNEMGPLSKAAIRVGGNPTEPDDDWSYMAPFSPTDVLEEYTRPARVFRDGRVVTMPALSDRHLFDVAGRGAMEAFRTDGLRSLLESGLADQMDEFTVRWPGHIDRYLRDIEAGELDEKNLLDEWRWDPARQDFTWMDVITESRAGDCARWVFDVGVVHGCSSMTTATGTVTLFVARALLDDSIHMDAGVYAPENLPEGFLQLVTAAFEQSSPGALIRVE